MDCQFILRPGFRRGWQSIMRLTVTDEDCCELGDRISAVWFHGTTEDAKFGVLHICSSIKGKTMIVVRSVKN